MLYKKRLFFQLIGILAVAAAVGMGFNAIGGIPLVGNWDADKEVHRGGNLPESPGIHYIDTRAAGNFYESGLGTIVDARSQAEYEEGHLPGAILCHVYNLDGFLADLLVAAPFDEPLMVYCIGENCEDSRFLAEALRETGYRLIYIYLGGYSGWLEAGLPVEIATDLDKTHLQPPRVAAVVDFTRLIPEPAWLGIDLLVLLFGLVVVYLLAKGKRESLPVVFSLKLVGVLFVAASLHKIASPLEFARIVHNYQILPGVLVNPVAIVLPWIEISCGLLLILGRLRQASAALLLGLIGIFVLAVGFNLVRGLDFDCGCFGAEHTSPWQVLLRDAGLFLCCFSGVLGHKGED